MNANKYTPGRDQKENDYRTDLCNRAAQVCPLYAAAPEMLEALRGLVHAIDYLNLDHSGWNEMDDARKAISRATEGAK